MDLIQTVTVGAGGAASIEFGTGGTIPQTYTDLLIVTSLRNASNEDVGIKLNGSTANFTNRYLFGNGSSTSSGTVYGNLAAVAPDSTYTANTFSNGAIYIANYRTSNNKSALVETVSENNATRGIQLLNAMLWSQTPAITSISLYQLNTANLAQYSSASLYGITAGSDGIVTVS